MDGESIWTDAGDAGSSIIRVDGVNGVSRYRRFNDPNILNNYEKLMQIPLNSEEEAKIANFSHLVESAKFVMELMLKDNKQMRKTKRQKLIASPGEVSQLIDQVEQKIFQEQARCVEVISECRNKPFWYKQRKEEIVNDEQQLNVKRWTQIVEKSAETFEKLLNLSKSKEECQPIENSEKADLLDELDGISKELSALSGVFDEYQ